VILYHGLNLNARDPRLEMPVETTTVAWMRRDVHAGLIQQSSEALRPYQG
jgi:hypothetical protein